MSEFAGKVVLITGSAGNLGKAVSKVFHNAGAKLVLTDNRPDRLQQTFGEWAEAGDCLIPAVDVTNSSAIENMVAETIEAFGRLDVLVNIAGGFRMGDPVHKLSEETWEFMLDLNARSVFLMSKAVIPHMLKQKSGKIISIAARAALEGKAKMGAYVVSKTAVIRLTETMSQELKKEGLNINCVLPGTIDTPQNRESMPDADFDKWVDPSAIADVIQFLASDNARAITGAAIPVYGKS